MGRFVSRAAFLGLIAIALLLPACGSGTGKQLLPAYTGPTVTGQDKLPNSFGPGSVGTTPTSTPAPPSPQPPQYAELIVFNAGTQPVFYLYVVPSTAPTWGVDQLGTEVIMPGEAFTLINIPPDTYDALAEFFDGTQVVTWDNVIEAGNIYSWTVSDV